MKKITVVLMFIVFASIMMGCTQAASNVSGSKDSSGEQDSQSIDESGDEKGIKTIPSTTTDKKSEKKSLLADQTDDRLERQSVLSDQLEILIPKGFKAESTNDQVIKFRDEAAQVMITITHDPEQRGGDQASKDDVERSLMKLAGIVKQNYPGAEVISEEVREVNGKHTAVVQVASKDQYVLLAWSTLNGEFLQFQISSPIGVKEEWIVIANKVIDSIQMN